MRNTWLKGLLFAAGVVLMISPRASAQLQSDFDGTGTFYGGTEGWFNYDGNPGFGVGTPAGASSNWLAVRPQQYWGKITSQSWATPGITMANWNSNTHLEFDVVVDDQWFPSGTATINIELQTDDGAGGVFNHIATPTIDTSLKNVIQHVSVPLASYQPFDPTAPNWNLSFNLSPGYAWEWDAANPSVVPVAATYYLDNIRWTGAVPEPASLVLVGSCLLFWVGRRPC